jgi:hypothetical protein
MVGSISAASAGGAAITARMSIPRSFMVAILVLSAVPAYHGLSCGGLKNVAMDYEEIDDDIEPEEFDDGEDWDEETLGLDLDENDARSVARDLGITSTL